MATPNPNRSPAQTATPNLNHIFPHFSFRFSETEVVNLNHRDGLGRLMVLIKARHELDPDPKNAQYIALTRVMQRFAAAYTLYWEDDEEDVEKPQEQEGQPQEQKDKPEEQKAQPEEQKDQPNPGDQLFTALESMLGVCRVLRTMKIPEGTELRSMINEVVAALEAFNDDDVYFKLWLEKESTMEWSAIGLMSND
ncbi:MAG: hypothetical protein Q9168_001499 [Polycauliona sp. 1 TL-2023]